jgi:hypothetical protein
MSNDNERKLTTRDEVTDFLLYTAPDGQVRVECVLYDETIWLTQDRIAELFGVQRPAITKHLRNIFESDELVEKVVVSILETTTQHGAIEGKTQTQSVKFYNLDAIISVGYRVNSSKATQFRIWATQLLKEYITKGFAMDDERLKNGRFFGMQKLTLKGKTSFFAAKTAVEKVHFITALSDRPQNDYPGHLNTPNFTKKRK